MCDRVLNNKPRTNNSVGSWHGTVTSDQQSHISVNKFVSVIKLEQSNTENLVVFRGCGK